MPGLVPGIHVFRLGSRKAWMAGTSPAMTATMACDQLSLRPYTPADEDAAIELWRRTWQRHYPHIDFAKRVDWWRERWRNELVPTATISVAERAGKMVGFVTVDPASGYLDQIVVVPEAWGSDVADLLMAEARRISPNGLDLKVNADNTRAIRFYEKQGFVDAGATINEISGAAVRLMCWRP
jgi:putative acetyltransferase